MKRLQLLILLSLSLFTFLSAQNSDDQKNSRLEIVEGQHQLGVSVGIIGGSTVLTHRYAIKDDLLLRSSISASFGSRLTRFNFRNIGSSTTIGIEKHKPFYNDWNIYYGADAHIGGNLSDFGETATLGITGLLGLNFHTGRNLSFFTEFGIGPGYRWSNVELLGLPDNSGITILGGLQIGVLVKLGK